MIKDAGLSERAAKNSKEFVGILVEAIIEAVQQGRKSRRGKTHQSVLVVETNLRGLATFHGCTLPLGHTASRVLQGIRDAAPNPITIQEVTKRISGDYEKLALEHLSRLRRRLRDSVPANDPGRAKKLAWIANLARYRSGEFFLTIDRDDIEFVETLPGV
jgi:hypothetical protein